MVTVANFRHGIKDGHLISQACLDDIRTNGIPGLNELIPSAKRIVIHLGSGWRRTRQTVKAFEFYLRQMGHSEKIATFYIPAFRRLGSKTMFDRLNADQKMVQSVQDTGGWAYAFRNAEGPYFDKVRINCWDAMEEILEYLEDGDLCVSIGHNGIIELMGNYFNPEIMDETINLKELEGIIFQANGQGYSTDIRLVRR